MGHLFHGNELLRSPAPGGWSLDLGEWSRSLHGLAITHKIDPGTKKRVKGTKTGYSKAVALPRRAEEILLLHEATTENTYPEDLIFTP
jgi:hypothetical protein